MCGRTIKETIQKSCHRILIRQAPSLKTAQQIYHSQGRKYPAHHQMSSKIKTRHLTMMIPLEMSRSAALLSHRGYKTTANADTNVQIIPTITHTEKPVTL
jgi:hypothetical protein